MADELLTVDEMAAVLKIHPVSLRRFVASRNVPVVRVGGSLRFQKDVVIDYFANGQPGPDRPTATSENVRRR
jgi:excisionase family DNA binding protein